MSDEKAKLPSCLTCPSWEPMNGSMKANDDGVIPGTCRHRSPVAHIVPVQTLQGPQAAVQGFFPPIGSNEWCSAHPELANKMTPLVYDKERGFNRAPTIDEAKAFAVKTEFDPMIDDANN